MAASGKRSGTQTDDVTTSAGDVADDVKNTAGDVADDLKDTAGDVADDVKDTAARTKEALEQPSGTPGTTTGTTTGTPSSPTAGLAPQEPTAGRTTTLRLPFVSATFTRTPSRPEGHEGHEGHEGNGAGGVVAGAASVVAGVGQAAASTAAAAVNVLPRNRVLFYTGVAALGVAGVVEWPVAALVATGTYVASRGRGRTAPGGAGTTDPAAQI